MIKQSKLSVQDICIIAIMTAVTAVLADREEHTSELQSQR